jgi:F-type H+-transporting ATPase subunit alpha
VDQQILILFAGVNGFLDNIPTARLGAYEIQLKDYLAKNHADIADTILNKKAIDDATKAKLMDALKAFEKVFS